MNNAKPVQIAATHSRTEDEHRGVEMLYVLLDDGRIFRWRSDYFETFWQEVEGPWVK